MAVAVDVGGPAAEVAVLHPPRQVFVRVAVGQRGDGHVEVRAAGAVRELQVVEQARVVGLAERRHPALAERVLERFFVAAGDRVDFVQEQHGFLYDVVLVGVVMAAMMSSTALSASVRISSSVRSWIGCGTKTRAGAAPSARAWASAASTNSVDATKTMG